jgi:hypothetical protein
MSQTPRKSESQRSEDSSLSLSLSLTILCNSSVTAINRPAHDVCIASCLAVTRRKEIIVGRHRSHMYDCCRPVSSCWNEFCVYIASILTTQWPSSCCSKTAIYRYYRLQSNQRPLLISYALPSKASCLSTRPSTSSQKANLGSLD